MEWPLRSSSIFPLGLYHFSAWMIALERLALLLKSLPNANSNSMASCDTFFFSIEKSIFFWFDESNNSDNEQHKNCTRSRFGVFAANRMQFFWNCWYSTSTTFHKHKQKCIRKMSSNFHQAMLYFFCSLTFAAFDAVKCDGVGCACDFSFWIHSSTNRWSFGFFGPELIYLIRSKCSPIDSFVSRIQIVFSALG